MMKSTRRWRLPALLATAALGAGAFAFGASPAQATADFAVTRIAGDTRHATAAQLATTTFPSGSTTAIIARDDTFPDALAGNYLAGIFGAPVLLSGTNSVPPVTISALDTLNVTSVYLLGGPTALSPAVANQLIGVGLTVNRIAGADRYDTAAQIALASGPNAVGTDDDGRRTAILSSGLNFPDALAAGPIVYDEHFPQLITGGGALPQTTKTALTTLDIDHVLITGGTVALPAGLEAELNGLGITSERIAGGTRFDTALLLAAEAGTEYGFEADHVNFATGANFPDALAGGPHAGKELAPIILVPNATTGDEFTSVCNALKAIAPTVASAHALGGPAVLADTTLTALDTCATPTGPSAGTGQVVTVTNGSDQYQFVQTSDSSVVTVTHDAQDTFTVDGAAASQAVFEAAITPGDQITFTDDATATDADVHALTNVSLLTGMVGDVNISTKTFYIINPVTGDRVGGPFVWDDATDNFGGPVAAFVGAISEGDTITVTGTQAAPTGFALTNGTVTGAVSAQTSDATDANIEIANVFGDEAETAVDDTFVAEAAPVGHAEVYVVDGATKTYAEFRAALSVGDTLAYKREVVAAVATETFTLTNVAPPQISGQVTSFINTAEDPAPDDPSGDRFTVVPAGGDYEVVDYSNTPGANFKVNNIAVTEAEFEAALTAGDTVVFQPGSAAPAIAETLSLTNAALSGQFAGINTAADFYGIFAADKETLLALVNYNLPNNQFFITNAEINPAQRTLAQWEAEAALVNLAPTDHDDPITVEIAGGFTNHRLTTPDDLTP